HYMINKGDKVHNFLLEVLINHGLISFIVFITFLGRSLLILIRTRRNINYVYIWPILWMTLMFLFASFTPSSILTLPFLWFVLGLIMCVRTIITDTKKNKVTTESKC